MDFVRTETEKSQATPAKKQATLDRSHSHDFDHEVKSLAIVRFFEY